MKKSKIGRRIAPTLAALIVPLALAAETPAPKTLITYEKLWMMKRVGAPVASPDGKWAVFSVLEPSLEADREVSDLWIVALDGSTRARRLTNTRAPEKDVVWSPDGRSIAFVTKREGDEAQQIYILDLAAGGEARRLTNVSTGASHPQWRPDGDAILFESLVYPGALDDEANRKISAEIKARKYNVRTYEHFPVRFWNHWLDERQPTIMVQALGEGSKAQDVLSATALARTSGFAGFAPAEDETTLTLGALWSPDGREIVFTATTERWRAAYANVGFRLYRVSSGGGEPRLVTAAAGTYRELAFAPDGKALFFKYALEDEELYHLERLERVAWPSGGEATLVTRGFDREIAHYAFAPDSSGVYLLAPEAGKVNMYRVSAQGGQPALLMSPSVGGYTALSIPRRTPKPLLIGTYGSSIRPPEIVRIDLTAQRHLNLTDFDTAAAAAIDWQTPQHFYFTSAKGRSIHSMIVLPPAFDATKKYPLLVFMHGGPASHNQDQFGVRWNHDLLAAPGYVVLMTDYTGSTGFGEKFTQAIKLDPLKTPADEINQAVDEASRRYPFIDGSRVCAAGASYGGHLANWLEATTTRYRCLVSHAGEVDLTTQWGESDMIYHREVMNGGPPWGGNPIWREQSPITYAANWKTPMLLSIGERDYRVPIGNTLENWAALQRMQVPSRLLVWPDAWHWITKPEDLRHFYEEMKAWLATYLKDETPARAPAR